MLIGFQELEGDGPHFALAVPPGEHPLDEARAEMARGTETTAVRVRLGEAPAVSWEMALRPGDDTRLLRAGEAYGFALGSDGGHPVWVGGSADGDVVAVVVLVDGMPALAAP
ncbi:DUF4241 domain-containing protein [Streptomyces sp. NPDC001502]|uniref:DUF4241 domain-containing protein n=1 Tax=Streptomyces sp. NPDC001502 TaxID=3364578 RepID=UPI0036C1D814